MAPEAKKPFEATTEAQEYINKLQMGRVDLPAEASMLEKEAYKQLIALQQRLGAFNQQQLQAEKKISELKKQSDGLRRDIDTVSGQMAAYAQMLVAAESERRSPPAPPAPPDKPKLVKSNTKAGESEKAKPGPKPKGEPGPKPKVAPEPEAESEPEPEAEQPST